MPVPKGAYARETMNDPRLERLQAELQTLRGIVADCPFIKGVPLLGVTLQTGYTRVVHKLGRKPVGVIPMRVSPAASFGFSPTVATDEAVAVNLVASATATFDLWFF